MTNGLSEDGKYFSIYFRDNMLGFYVGSRKKPDNVRPYTNNCLLPVIVLDRGNEWQADILEKLNAVRDELITEGELHQYVLP